MLVHEIDKMKFIGINSNRIDYKNHIKTGSKIVFSDLTEYDLSNLDLTDCTFFGCRMDLTNFEHCNLKNSKFVYCFITSSEKVAKLNHNQNIILEECNFLIEEGKMVYSENQKYRNMVQVLQKIDSTPFSKMIDVVNDGIDFNINRSLVEIYGFAHLYFKQDSCVESGVFFEYKKILLDKAIKPLLGERYDDLYELFLSQLRDTYVSQDVLNYFEEFFYTSEQAILLKIIGRLYRRIESPVASDLWIALKAMLYFSAYEDVLMTMIDQEKLIYLMLHKEDEIRNKARRVVEELMSFYILDTKKYQQIEQTIRPILVKALKHDNELIQLDGLLFLERHVFFDWLEGMNCLKNIKKNHSNAVIREKATLVYHKLEEAQDDI